MKIAKVRSEVLKKALESREFFALGCYLSSFQRTPDGCFISAIVEFEGKPTLSIRLSIDDYCFNEKESEGIWILAQKVIGRSTIDLEVCTIVEL